VGCDPKPKVAVLSYLGKTASDNLNPNGVAAGHISNAIIGLNAAADATPLGPLVVSFPG